MKLSSIPHAESMPALNPCDDSSDSYSSDGTNNVNHFNHAESTSCLTDLSHYDDETILSPGGTYKGTELVKPHVGYKKVLVTGAAGFVGSSVAKFLLERGDDVVVVDEINDYYDPRIKEANIEMLRQLSSQLRMEKHGANGGPVSRGSCISIYKGDICDDEFILSVFERERPSWICHMAARAGVRPSIQDPFIYIHSNIKGTTQLMELAHKYECENFVFASSSSVYGGSTSTFFSEEDNVDNPVSPYAASKKACELLAYTYHHLYNLNVTGLRFFTVYGPRGRPDMAPFKFIDRVSRGMEMQQFGDGSSSRDYTYITDIVDGVIRAIDRPYSYQVFNLGKGSGTSLKEFISIVEKHVGQKAIVKVMPDQPGDVPYTCADVSKAKALLNYEAGVSFDEGIRRTVEWYKCEYGKSLQNEPETQANGMGRAASTNEIRSKVNSNNDDCLRNTQNAMWI